MHAALLVDADQWDPKSVHSLVRRVEELHALQAREAFGAFDGNGAQAPWRGLYERLRFTVHPRVGKDAADDALVERARGLAPEASELWVATRDRDLLQRVAKVVASPARLIVPVETPAGAELHPISVALEPPGEELQRQVIDAVTKYGGEKREVLLSVLKPLVKVDPRVYGYLRLRDALQEMPQVSVRGGAQGGEVVVALR